VRYFIESRKYAAAFLWEAEERASFMNFIIVIPNPKSATTSSSRAIETAQLYIAKFTGSKKRGNAISRTRPVAFIEMFVRR
jgi:hypothetical protein